MRSFAGRCPLCVKSGLTHRSKKDRYSITSSASESSLCMCCSPSFAWTHSLIHRRCWPIFLLDVQKLQRCVPNVGDLMPRDWGSVYVAAGTNLDLPCALLVPHLRLASA